MNNLKKIRVWVLNFLPLLCDIAIFVTSRIFGIKYNFDIVVYCICFLFITPLYLLFVNFFYLKLKKITNKHSLICMFSVIVGRVLLFLIDDKIMTGELLGNIPLEVIYIALFVPMGIVIIGWLIRWITIRKKCKQ